MKFRVFSLILCLLFISCAVWSFAQEMPERRRGPGGPGGGTGGGPPWMRGGEQGGDRGGRDNRGGPEGGPPWMRGEQGRDGGNRGGPGGAGRPGEAGGGGGDNDRLLGMLRGMDRNRNGKLDPDEIPEYRRAFVSNAITRLGGDPNKTVDLDDLARRASGRQSSSSRSTASSTSSSSSLPTDPLVPYFGEDEPKETPILGFGEREPQPKVAAKASTANASSLSQSDQILRSAREIMNKFDKNKSGALEKDKGEWVSSLPFKPETADKNRDGRITMSEIVEVLGGKSGASSGAAVVATKQSVAYDHLPQGVPDWFFERDKDQDGQLTMMEYANGLTWTEAVADEFAFLDKNGDGIATVAEVFVVLKQVDEEKRLKEEQAKRDKERLRGVGAQSEPERPAEGTPQEGTPPPPPSGQQTPRQPGESPTPPEGTPAKPVERSPNWQPGGSTSTAIPANAPYSSGSERSIRRDGNRGGERNWDRSNMERNDNSRPPRRGTGTRR